MARTMIALVGAALLMPFAASAQTQQTSTTTTYASPEQMNQSAWGPTTAINLGVGVSNYDRGLSSESQPGAGYQGLIELSPARMFGVELGYQGAVNDIRSQFSSDGRLVTNQIGGDLRLNFVPPGFDLPGGLKPFVFGGAAYQRIDPRGFTPGISTASALAVPVGAGLEANVGGGFLIGARYTYNILVGATDALGGRDADNWLASVNIGARFGM